MMQLLSLVVWSLLVYSVTYLMNWHLTGILLLYILWTAFYFVRSRGSDSEAHRPSQRTYILGLIILLVAGLFNFTGLGRYGSRLLDRFGEARRLEHSGYYIHPENPRGFMFKGMVDGDGFEVPAFVAGDSLVVRPIHDLKTSTHPNWHVSYNLQGQPFRVNGVCKNVSLWLSPGDRFQVIHENGGDGRPDTSFFTLRFEIPRELSMKQRVQTWLGDLSTVNRYFFNQGTVRDGRMLFDFEEDVLLSEVNLQEGQKLSSLADKLDTKHRNWSDIFAQILVVRERKYDPSSRIGLLLTEEPENRKGLAFKKNGLRLDDSFISVRAGGFQIRKRYLISPAKNQSSFHGIL
ncbi:hypothetical protein MJD09_23830, partial [bacterium]|nr:hypothetical protein [bacterium]